MNNRERLLTIMSGKPPDRIPWIPRLLLWYNAHRIAGTLPQHYRDWSLRDIERDLGMGTPARDGRVFRTETRGVEVRERWLNEKECLSETITPVGTVTTLFRGSELLRQKGIQDLQVEFALKRREDYAVVEYIIEHTDVIPTYADYETYEHDVGQDGYPLVSCGDCPFHHWMRALVGYNNAFYHLNDYPHEVGHLLSLMERRDREVVWPIIADAPARLLLHGAHFSSQMTPPPLFEKYILPYYEALSALMKPRDKMLVMHGDADSRRILTHIERAGYGMVECFVSAPMVETTLAEARAAWGNRIIIWGGIPSVILEDPYTDEEFDTYMAALFRTIAPGDAFILGVADNVMPGAKIERLRRVTQMVEERGAYPIGNSAAHSTAE